MVAKLIVFPLTVAESVEDFIYNITQGCDILFFFRNLNSLNAPLNIWIVIQLFTLCLHREINYTIKGK